MESGGVARKKRIYLYMIDRPSSLSQKKLFQYPAERAMRSCGVLTLMAVDLGIRPEGQGAGGLTGSCACLCNRKSNNELRCQLSHQYMMAF